MSRIPAPPAKASAPGRPKDLGKGAAILEAAKRMFTAHGFDGVSMDQIAAEAGVSKLTVYSHFGDKESLFAAAVRSHCERGLPDAIFATMPEVPLRERLLRVARAFFTMISTPEAIAGHRILCSPKMANSPLPQLFWEAGPRRIQSSFAELLVRRADELDVPDPALASAQFFALLKGEPHAQLVFGCCTVRENEIEPHLAAAVDMFLRAYAKR